MLHNLSGSTDIGPRDSSCNSLPATVNDFAEVSVSQYDFLTMPTYVLVSRLPSDAYSIAYLFIYFLRTACQACVFFAADASNAVTGQSLSVDGGLTMP